MFKISPVAPKSEKVARSQEGQCQYQDSFWIPRCINWLSFRNIYLGVPASLLLRRLAFLPPIHKVTCSLKAYSLGLKAPGGMLTLFWSNQEELIFCEAYHRWLPFIQSLVEAEGRCLSSGFHKKKYHSLGGLNNRNLFSSTSGDWTPKIQVPVWSVPAESSFLGLQTVTFSLCPTWAFPGACRQRQRGSKIPGVCSYKSINLIIRASPS